MTSKKGYLPLKYEETGIFFPCKTSREVVSNRLRVNVICNFFLIFSLCFLGLNSSFK